MTAENPLACRRALRDIREIAAVARLDGAPMSGQEALQTIAAIAGWAAGDSGAAPADCADVIGRIHVLIGETEVDTLPDARALSLFRDVGALLQARTSAGATTAP